MSDLPIRMLVSGGQTGVDRAALDAAIDLRLPCGGWCPAGRWAEDGGIPVRYPLRETPSPDPAQRTTWNAFDADATLVVGSEPATGGTALAAATARRSGRPVLVVGSGGADVERTLRWLDQLPRPLVLNVAGPRESDVPGSYAATVEFLKRVLAAARAVPAAPRLALVTGAAGFLGSRLIALTPPGWVVLGTVRSTPADRPDFVRVDLADADAVDRVFESAAPDVVLHTAYSTTRPESDIWLATKHVADAAARGDARVVHLSSDMVLDGENAPYDENAPRKPVNEYGAWKARAEEYVESRTPETAIVRLSLITSIQPPDPRTRWIIDGLRGGRGVHLFVDELRSPILVDDLARQLWEIVRLAPEARAGVWNLAGPESMSRFAIGAVVAAAHDLDPSRIVPATARSHPEPRPRDLRLLTRRADAGLLTRARPISAAVGTIDGSGV